MRMLSGSQKDYTAMNYRPLYGPLVLEDKTRANLFSSSNLADAYSWRKNKRESCRQTVSKSKSKLRNNKLPQK